MAFFLIGRGGAIDKKRKKSNYFVLLTRIVHFLLHSVTHTKFGYPPVDSSIIQGTSVKMVGF